MIDETIKSVNALLQEKAAAVASAINICELCKKKCTDFRFCEACANQLIQSNQTNTVLGAELVSDDGQIIARTHLDQPIQINNGDMLTVKYQISVSA